METNTSSILEPTQVGHFSKITVKIKWDTFIISFIPGGKKSFDSLAKSSTLVANCRLGVRWMENGRCEQEETVG
jgi:hypothetical protein